MFLSFFFFCHDRSDSLLPCFYKLILSKLIFVCEWFCLVGFVSLFFTFIIFWWGSRICWLEGLLMHLLCLDWSLSTCKQRVTGKFLKALFALHALITIINEIQQLDAEGNFVWMPSKLLSCIKLSATTELPINLFPWELEKGRKLWC